MSKIRIKLEDTKLLDNLIQVIRTDYIDKTVNSAIKKSIYVLLADVIRRVPVDTGKLKRSHQVKFGHLSGEIFTEVDYAEKVHEGIGQRSQPWLRDSLVGSKERIEQIFNRKIDYLIKRV